MKSASHSRTPRPRMKMARRPLPLGARTLLLAVVLTIAGIGWVKKMSWYEQTSNELLALEKSESSLKNEWGNLQSELITLSGYRKVEADARTRLGMTFPAVPPDTIWTDTPVEHPSLGSLAFLSPIPFRERASSHRR